VESLLKIDAARDALARLAHETGDATRDLPPATRDLVRKSIGGLEAPGDDLESLSRVFGEELPSGLTLRDSVSTET
jgi:hypothetical protein